MSSGQRQQRVAIVGAGMSGLAAACKLTDAGHQVDVLEAQLHPGGRVQTIRQPFADELYAEAGAIFVPSNHDLTLSYVQRFHVDLEAVPEDRIGQWFVRGHTVRLSGASEDWPVDLTAEERRLGLQGMVDKYVTPVASQLGDFANPGWPGEELNHLDQIPYGEFLRGTGASAGAIYLMSREVEGLNGDSIENMSALYCLLDHANFEGGSFSVVRGGTDLLPKAVASHLGARIHYGAVVHRIEQNGDGVAVTYSRAGREKQLTADQVICALQVSCLSRIAFFPALPQAKRTAIEQLRHTSVSRIYVQTASKFWGENGPGYWAVTDLPIQFLRDPSYHLPSHRGLLECYTTGATARRVAGMSEADRIQFAVRELEALYPGLGEHVEGGVAKCWDDDPWARGAYVSFKTGQMTTLLRPASAPEGRVHFAGDHLSPFPGWMQGAIFAGHHAAAEVAHEPALTSVG